MRIVSSFMNDICIRKGKLHTITFESSYIQSEFRKLLQSYFQSRKQEEKNYLKILNKSGNEIKANEFFFVSFDCNVISLQNEKNTKKLLQDLLFYYLEHNSNLIDQYMKFNENLNVFASNLEIGNNDILIEFYPTDKTIKSLLQSFEITIEYRENEYVPNYVLRDFLIKSILQMNVLEKNVILLLSYPETDVGLEDYTKIIDLLHSLNVTTLIITSHRDFLTLAEEDKLFLVDKNGELYDLINLRKELIAFDIVEESNSEKLSKILAYQDFKQDYTLMDNYLIKFLKSNRL